MIEFSLWSNKPLAIDGTDLTIPPDSATTVTIDRCWFRCAAEDDSIVIAFDRSDNKDNYLLVHLKDGSDVTIRFLNTEVILSQRDETTTVLARQEGIILRKDAGPKEYFVLGPVEVVADEESFWRIRIFLSRDLQKTAPPEIGFLAFNS